MHRGAPRRMKIVLKGGIHLTGVNTICCSIGYGKHTVCSGHSSQVDTPLCVIFKGEQSPEGPGLMEVNSCREKTILPGKGLDVHY
ncbi:hypothetical protein HKBW3S43_01637 [Candidatus Hakubella thermalkaliphila]|uniref:Uncharacterized protein n=1 Tax=Candidatus Hakubella thermalkaliphila TaxID=2754717 RepID=A0A6V8P4Q4_9ACTN|nr:hypothetical protein [Candidatus Hakubella thermalkaliphila]GFP24962.1 hypothetical protein HKBW3S25_00400 [Candidatus Hakubella thermalkaliphila]GFP27468.1 hypothetical protein HKBW3S33_00881 [Candidatus Hakubella thermalkaliphila]GFP35850.1 hypothetical protein HKBW3S43_01637 [Candidatus Hakubella thermalkaliphila]